MGLEQAELSGWVREGRLQPLSGPGIDESGVYLFLRQAMLELAKDVARAEGSHPKGQRLASVEDRLWYVRLRWR